MGKSLITGITGFVGSHLADLLLDRGEEIYGTYRWRSPKNNIKHIENKINLVNCDLLDSNSVMNCIEKVNPDIIYHLAAQSDVKKSFDEPSYTIQTNILSTVHLLEAVRKLKMNPIMHICSSSEVYGRIKENEIPIKETNPFRPTSPYAIGKIGEDMVGLQYFLSYGLKTLRTRTFIHIGPRGREVGVVSVFAKQIAKIEKELQKPILKVGDLNSVRTFTDVRDVVKAYYLLVKKCPPGEVYNIGGNRTIKIGEMLDILLEISNMKDKIQIKVDQNLLRPSDVILSIPCVDKFVKITGWKPKITLEKTLEDILQWWREKV